MDFRSLEIYSSSDGYYHIMEKGKSKHVHNYSFDACLNCFEASHKSFPWRYAAPGWVQLVRTCDLRAILSHICSGLSGIHGGVSPGQVTQEKAWLNIAQGGGRVAISASGEIVRSSFSSIFMKGEVMESHKLVTWKSRYSKAKAEKIKDFELIRLLLAACQACENMDTALAEDNIDVAEARHHELIALEEKMPSFDTWYQRLFFIIAKAATDASARATNYTSFEPKITASDVPTVDARSSQRKPH